MGNPFWSLDKMEEGSEDKESVASRNAVHLVEEQQSCAGNIFTKFKCIRGQELDSPNDETVSERDVAVEVPSAPVQEAELTQDGDEITNGTQVGDDTSTVQSNHNIQGCSGSILTTFQCIAMPAADSEVSSINSMENHRFIPSKPNIPGSSVRESFRSGKDAEVGSAVINLDDRIVSDHVSDQTDSSSFAVPSTSSGVTSTEETASEVTGENTSEVAGSL